MQEVLQAGWHDRVSDKAGLRDRIRLSPGPRRTSASATEGWPDRVLPARRPGPGVVARLEIGDQEGVTVVPERRPLGVNFRFASRPRRSGDGGWARFVQLSEPLDRRPDVCEIALDRRLHGRLGDVIGKRP
jgi:hypothetical protein